MTCVTITSKKVTYHKHPRRDPALRLSDLPSVITRYLEVVPAPSALYLYEDQLEWFERQAKSTRGIKACRLLQTLKDKGIKIVPIRREA